jgi:hypothetical protein
MVIAGAAATADGVIGSHTPDEPAILPAEDAIKTGPPPIRKGKG